MSTALDVFLVAVIIPVYNVKPFFDETISSVLQQTYHYLEIILVDDGSTDGSELLCDQYAALDSRIKVIHQENQGLSGARNTGLDYMTGDLVVFLDGDDTLHPDAIRRMTDALSSEDADIVMCKSLCFWTEGFMDYHDLEKVNHAGKAGKYTCRDVLKATVEGKILHNAWGKIYKAEIWKDLRYPAGLVYEDTYLAFEVMEKAECVHVIDDPLVMHRKRAGSITLTASVKNFRDCCIALDHYTDCIAGYVPDLFSEEDLMKAKSSSFASLMNHIIRVDQNNLYRKEIDGLFADYIREFDRAVGLEKCTLKTRVACRLFLLSPSTFRLLYLRYTGWKNQLVHS